MRRNERLYQLLPAVLRHRDVEHGEPLRALMAILESELVRIEQETETTWDDWFIETCEEWLVPYIGEALGVRGLRSLSATGFSPRAFVANSLAYRRRKGTAAVLEQLARDVTGHGSRVVEYFQRLVTTPHLLHVREKGKLPSSLGTVELRDSLALERLSSPFGRHARTPEVRHIDRSASATPVDGAGEGLWNLPNIGLHLWRLRSVAITRSEARAVVGESEWFRFEPHGRDIPLFNLALSETEIGSIAGPEHVPRALSRVELSREERGELPPRWLSPDSLLRVRLLRDDGTEALFTPAGDLVLDTDADGIPDAPQDLVAVGTEELPRLQIAHLGDSSSGGLPARRPPDERIVYVDPQNGRLVFHPNAVSTPPVAVLVDYAVGFAGEIGAGVWDRTRGLTEQLAADGVSLAELTAQWGVSRSEADGVQVFGTLGEALAAWNAHVAASSDPAAETGLIALMDNRAYTRADDGGTPVGIDLPAGARLIVLAATWPVEVVDGLPQRQLGSVSPSRLRPIITGELRVTAESPAAAADTRAGGLWLNGLSIEGGVRVTPGGLERLSLMHCTTVAPGSGIEIESAGAGSSNAPLELRLVRCVVGPVVAAGSTARATFDACTVHGADAAVDLPDATLTFDASTAIGTVRCRVLWSSNAIFAGLVDAEHTQQGCVRFGYLPLGSHVPRRFRCQPDQALEGVNDPALRERVVARVRPAWTSLDPAHPAYAALAARCPHEIARGAEDGREMGVYFHLQHPWREDNLRAALRQFLRHGLEAGLRYES